MDPSLISLIPTGGVAGVLVVVIVYLLRQNHADRKQYRDDVARIEANHTAENALMHERHAAEVKDLHDQHATKLDGMQHEITGLRTQVRDALGELDQARRDRWHLEDVAAGYRRQLGYPEPQEKTQ